MADMSGGGSKQISNFVAGCLLSSQCGENRFEGEFLAFSTIPLTRTFLIFISNFHSVFIDAFELSVLL
jgi:hypothetical protein